MTDPVALAWSGRIAEAREAALAQASPIDPFLAGQSLEALAILGEHHGVRSNPELDAVLAEAVSEPALVRKAIEAAAALDSTALDDFVDGALRDGRHVWSLFRHVGIRPSLRFARALAHGWNAIPRELLDIALLTTRTLPVATKEEAAEWGARALRHVGHALPEVREAAFEAVAIWASEGAVEACERGLEDEAREVREAAARALSWIRKDA